MHLEGNQEEKEDKQEEKVGIGNHSIFGKLDFNVLVESVYIQD